MSPRRYLIMGASSGLGRMLALKLLERGDAVALAARSLEPLQQICAQYPQTAVCLDIDVNSDDAPQRLQRLIDLAGGMDVYVHVAGIGYDNPEQRLSREVAMANTDVVGFVRMVYAAYLYFIKTRPQRPQIVAVSSVAGTKGIVGMSAYSASKAFDSTYLVALEQESRLRGYGIAFTDIKPGWTQTPLLRPGAKYPLRMRPERVVAAMVRAMDRHRRVAVIDGRWRILVSLWRAVPNWLWLRLPQWLLKNFIS